MGEDDNGQVLYRQEGGDFTVRDSQDPIDIRNLCARCLIKVFDTVLGKPK